ncbi:ATP synthase F0 sector subunit C [Neisseria bacilliformis ATCC BAA-1200]|uniref:ATP synthase F0 sector subunit C n=1 Tax=Neisseria bacilliformis ATCC BAA-1200 TaxID=888742 RepID=F2B9H2_9NEIS|nr:ATP synthase F0 sector subunit C [Neisseria bacilliformis ATCC BAA-1200]
MAGFLNIGLAGFGGRLKSGKTVFGFAETAFSDGLMYLPHVFI